MERQRVFDIIYWISIPFIIVNAILFVWQLGKAETNDIVARICFSFMIIGCFILIVLLMVQITIKIVQRMKERETNPKDRLIPSIRHSFSLRKQKSIQTTGKLGEDHSQRFYDRFGTYERELQLSSQVYPAWVNAEKIEISLDSLIYDEEILDERCVICKLTFVSKQVVVFCPNCENLFHEEHLSEWLKQKPNCPICSYIFDRK